MLTPTRPTVPLASSSRQRARDSSRRGETGSAIDAQHRHRAPAWARGYSLAHLGSFGPKRLQPRGPKQPAGQRPAALFHWYLSALAKPVPRIDDASMAHLVRGLDNVAWVVLTALLVIVGIALLGFLFLAAI